MRNGTLRKPVHRAVAAALYPDSSNTHSGLDRVVREDFDLLRNKRYALLTNHAAVDFLGRHILDVLALAPEDCRLVRIFSPEHGIAGTAEAGQHVDSGRWKGIPVVSLYGGQQAPDPAQLNDIDVLIVDLQDVGARYYTYHATMKRCLAVCEAHRVPVVVLDRPNPLGGLVLEGPLAVDTTSIVSAAAVPIRHGMTLGEFALWYRQSEFRRLSLEIMRLDGWRYDLYFDQTSLPWIPPSPNIATPTTALWYVGNCLFEGVNLNEGRGTETPFEVIGAPWLDAARVIDRIPNVLRSGAQLEPTLYTPTGIPGKAANPLYKDTECGGIRFRLADRALVRPFSLALGLIAAIRALHPDQFAWSGQPAFDTLIGSSQIRTALESGTSAEDLLRRSEPELRQFYHLRPKLYHET